MMVVFSREVSDVNETRSDQILMKRTFVCFLPEMKGSILPYYSGDISSCYLQVAINN